MGFTGAYRLKLSDSNGDLNQSIQKGRGLNQISRSLATSIDPSALAEGALTRSDFWKHAAPPFRPFPLQSF